MTLKTTVGLSAACLLVGTVLGAWLAAPRPAPAVPLPPKLSAEVVRPHEVPAIAAPPDVKILEKWHVVTKEVKVPQEVVKEVLVPMTLPDAKPKFRVVFDVEKVAAGEGVGLRASGACEASADDGQNWHEVARATQDLERSSGEMTPEAKPVALAPPPPLPPRWRIAALAGITTTGEKVYMAAVTRRLGRTPIHGALAAGSPAAAPWAAAGVAFDLR